jgi:hypothetical protein
MRKFVLTATAVLTLAVTACQAPSNPPTTQPPVPSATASGTPAPGSQVPTPSCTQIKSVSRKQSGDAGNNGVIINVRQGRHACFDQVTFDMQGAGALPVHYRVEYVDKVTTGGRGDEVPVEGSAILRVIIFAWDYTHPTDAVPTPSPTPSPAWRVQTVVATGDGPSMVEVKHAGAHEGQTTFAVGVRGQQPFEVDYWNGHVILFIAHPTA